MSRVKTLQVLFQRYRRPGDIVFAWLLLIFSLALLSQLWSETTWRGSNALFAQPRFWPGVSLAGMVIFSSFHLLSSALSKRIEGRWAEVWVWIKSLEYAGWFILYALVVPFTGYLPTTVVFAVALALRSGYRGGRALLAAAASAIAIVVLFKSLLKVSLPAGAVYQYLPDGIRQFFLIYF